MLSNDASSPRGAATSRDGRRGLVALGGAVAVLQLALSLSLDGSEYQGVIAMAWGGALWLLWSAPCRPELSRRSWETVLGLVLLAMACAATFRVRAGYHPVHRILPLAAALGLLTASSGVRGLRHHGRELALMALPLVDPLPRALRDPIEPIRATASAAVLLLKAIGVPVERHGAILDVPGARVEVLGICSGIEMMTQLLALVVLVSCLFPSSWRQRVWLAASAVAAGFSVNAARVAFLSVIAWRAPDRWTFWERPGPGSHLFPLTATALAGLAWWLVLRTRDGAQDRGVGFSK